MPSIDSRRIGAGMLAGLAGGVAFTAVMKMDIALSGERVDDFQLLANVGPLREQWRLTGPIIHAINSISLGALYAIVSNQMSGPGWLRGLAFAQIENIAPWPVVMMLDRAHPAIRSGDLPTYHRPWPFVAETLRHAAFGDVLGSVFERLWFTTNGDVSLASRY